MNVERILNMVLRMVTRKLINKGMRHMAGKPPQGAGDRANRRQAQQASKLARMARRIR
jgi:hypothetical protein